MSDCHICKECEGQYAAELQARVKELEAEVFEWQSMQHNKEIIRLRKVVDAARELQKYTDRLITGGHGAAYLPGQLKDYLKANAATVEALRELDGGKKYKVGPNPNYERDKNKRECKCGNYHCPGDC